MNSILLRKTSYSLPLLLIITLIMWYVPIGNNEVNYTLFHYNVSPFLSVTISYLITLFASSLINKILGETIFGNENSNAFVLFFMAITSLSVSFPELIVLSAINFCFCVSIVIILNLEEKNAVKNLFNATFILGFLSFLFVLFLPFTYLIGVGASFLRRIRFVDILVILFSLLLPVFILFMLAFITSDYSSFKNFLVFNFITPTISIAYISVWVFLFLFSIVGIASLRSNRTFGGSKSIKASRIIIWLFILSYILGVVNLFLYDSLVFFVCIALPSAVYVSSFFLKSNYSYKSLYMSLFLIVCFISNYFI